MAATRMTLPFAVAVAHTVTPTWSAATAERTPPMPPSVCTSAVPERQAAPSSDVAWTRWIPSAAPCGMTACSRPAGSSASQLWMSSPDGNTCAGRERRAVERRTVIASVCVPESMNSPSGPLASDGESA